MTIALDNNPRGRRRAAPPPARKVERPAPAYYVRSAGQKVGPFNLYEAFERAGAGEDVVGPQPDESAVYYVRYDRGELGPFDIEEAFSMGDDITDGGSFDVVTYDDLLPNPPRILVSEVKLVLGNDVDAELVAERVEALASERGVYLSDMTRDELQAFIVLAYLASIPPAGALIHNPNPRRVQPLQNPKADPMPIPQFQAELTQWLEDKGLWGDTGFYSQDEWRDRGEQYLLDAELILVFEGALYGVLNGHYPDSYKLMDEFYKFVEDRGYYAELGNAWNAGFYVL